MAGIVPIGSIGGHPVQVIVLRALGGEVVGNVLDKVGAGDDAHHLHTTAGCKGGDVLLDAVSHQRIVGNIPGRVDLFPVIGFLLRLCKERGADILAAGKEHTIHLSHGLSHIGIGKVLCLDLVRVGLLKHAALLQTGAGHLVAAVILHSIGSDLGQLYCYTACCTDHGGKCCIILRIALPADTDKRLAFHGLSIGHHLNEHSLVHCAVRAVLHSLS